MQMQELHILEHVLGMW